MNRLRIYLVDCVTNTPWNQRTLNSVGILSVDWMIDYDFISRGRRFLYFRTREKACNHTRTIIPTDSESTIHHSTSVYLLTSRLGVSDYQFYGFSITWLGSEPTIFSTEYDNSRLPRQSLEVWIAHLVEFCLSKATNLTSSCPTFWLNKILLGLIKRIISAIESFCLSIVVRKLKRIFIFFPFKSNNSYKESSDSCNPWRLLYS